VRGIFGPLRPEIEIHALSGRPVLSLLPCPRSATVLSPLKTHRSLRKHGLVTVSPLIYPHSARKGFYTPTQPPCA